MNQFKEEFMGRGRKELQKATTSQKCLRVPDLDNVGLTPRHHTFFEMLGNFSFGDYFKAETIPWEWQFFTEILGLDPDRFVATVYTDDDEAFAIWHESIGLPKDRIFRFGEEENFWPASAPSKGPNGPCGPCSEIYWDQNPSEALPSHPGLEDLPSRFIEVGNFVFTQFDRQEDGSLPPLPQKNIDVGLGLERIAAVVQGAVNNFETDLFHPTLETLQQLSGRTYGANEDDDIRMRRIADHCRAVFFCIADGAAPGREGRSYVVRKILRRAVRDGIDLGLQSTFLPELLPAVQNTMGEFYPELHEQQSTIEALSLAEEERFRDVYEKGISRLESEIDATKASGSDTFSGSAAFELHDTYGFPCDITEVVLKDNNLNFDQEGFETAMSAQRERARSGSDIQCDVFAESVESQIQSAGGTPTQFLGYDCLESSSTVLGFISDCKWEDSLSEGQSASLLLSNTPFYAEGGGQVGDSGKILSKDGTLLFKVDTTTQEGEFFLHSGTAVGEISKGLDVQACVNPDARCATERHHTATHLLHAALRKVLGSSVNQAGSHVSPERFRFDYTHPQAASGEELLKVERLVTEQILKAAPVSSRLSTLEEAKNAGVTALFGEKYGSEVRVVDIPDFSAELCGGTHVQNTGQIGPFRISSDRSLAAGVRRIEGVAGWEANAQLQLDRSRLQSLAASLKTTPDLIEERVAKLRIQLKEAKQGVASSAPSPNALARDLNSQAAGSPLGWARLLGLDAQSLRNLADGLQAELALPPVVLLMGGEGEQLPFIFLVQKDSGRHAGHLAKQFGSFVAGGGGGRPDFAQGKGSKGSGLEAGIAAISEALSSPA
jgi:alanyl-tRNA synthetase